MRNAIGTEGQTIVLADGRQKLELTSFGRRLPEGEHANAGNMSVFFAYDDTVVCMGATSRMKHSDNRRRCQVPLYWTEQIPTARTSTVTKSYTGALAIQKKFTNGWLLYRDFQFLWWKLIAYVCTIPEAGGQHLSCLI